MHNGAGHDADDNLTLVRVWKNGVLWASVGGGDGTNSEASDSTSDTGPVSVTFTAQATDAAERVEVGALLRGWLAQGTRLAWFNRGMAAVLVLTAVWMGQA